MVEENPPTDTADDDNGPFPGWYPDPLAVAAERFWNGREWTGNARGEVPVAPVAGPAVSADTVTGSPAGAESVAGTHEVTPASKPRIFGTATDDTPPPASSTPQGERVKSALAQRAATGSAAGTLFDTPLDTPLDTPPDTRPFSGSADTRSVTAQAASADGPSLTTENELTSNGKGAAPQPSAPLTPVPAPDRTGPVRQPADPSLERENPPANGRRRSWPAVMIAGLCALALGLAGGWFARGSGEIASDATPAIPVTTSVQPADEQDTPQNTTEETEPGADSADDVSGVDREDLDEIQGQVENLSAELDQAQSDLETITAERDNEQAHNDILQTWFTPEVRERSERNWNAEVERACSAEGVPTLGNTAYTRAMELMGTHADLVAAAVACQAGG